MLGKVMKYELRAQLRTLLPLFGAGLASVVAARLLLALVPVIWQPAGFVVSRLAVALAGLVSMAVVLLSVVVVLYRFYQSMVGSEGYLTFTLPVKNTTQVWGRLLASTASVCAGVVTTLLCVKIMSIGLPTGDIVYYSHGNMAEQFVLTGADIPFGTKAALVAIMAVFCVLMIGMALLHAYACFAIGAGFARHKLLGSIGGFYVLNAAESLVTVVAGLLVGRAVVGRDLNAAASFLQANFTGGLLMANPDLFFRNLVLLFAAVCGFVLVVYALFSVGHWLLVRHRFGNNLNLE